MGKRMVDDKEMTDYLLGSLAGAEAERLDELSVADDEFAHALRAAEDDLVDAYVRGELAVAELERFESHYLSSPLRRERVELARALVAFAEKKAGAESVRPAERGDAAPAVERKGEGREGGGWLSALRGLGSLPLPLRAGAAFAALALLAALVWLALDISRTRRQPTEMRATNDTPAEREPRSEVAVRPTPEATNAQESGRERAEEGRPGTQANVPGARGEQTAEGHERPAQGQRQSPAVGVASFVLTPQLRGGAQAATLSLPAGAGVAAIRLQLEPGDFTSYRVELLGQHGHDSLWRREGLRASGGELKFLSVRLGAGLLKPGASYTLRVSGERAGSPPEVVADYPFRVVK